MCKIYFAIIPHVVNFGVRRKMKTFEESGKSKKTVASMIESKTEEPGRGKKKGKGREYLP